jgi:hypothetical protein
MRSPLPVVGGSGVSIDATSPITGPGGDRAILERGVDHMAPGEFFGAMHNVIQDIEQMHRGIAEGRGGGREAGVSELVSGVVPSSC